MLNLRAVAEAYPQLQAIQEFKDLSENLTATEDKIAFARRFYNGNVRDYNTAIQTVPTNFIASVAGIRHFGRTERPGQRYQGSRNRRPLCIRTPRRHAFPMSGRRPAYRR